MSPTTMPTAATIVTPPGPPATVSPPYPSYCSHIYRLTVTQYDQMVQAGILGKRDRVELLEGILVAKVGRDRPHIVSGNKALRTLQETIPPGWHVAKEDPLTVSDLSKPEPDIAVVRGQAEDYKDRDVTARDVALVVEIAESALRADQNEMKPMYAASAIPVYWIINLVDDQVEAYSDPVGREYRTSQVFSREQEVPLVIGGTEVARIRAADLLS